MCDAVVFLGPTLPRAQAEALLDAVYLPPVRQGDVVAAVRQHRPRAVLIIDGVFHQELAVWHKEILWAIDQGVRVYGASSMGALRAAECAHFGMIGVGRIFEMYQRGELHRDDEVALAHGDAEDGWRKRGEAMVNLRATLERAGETGLLPPERARAAITWLEGLHFSRRSYGAVAAWLRDQGQPAEARALLDVVCHPRLDLKADDAVAALKLVAEHRSRQDAAGLPEPFQHSGGFHTLLHRDRPVQVEGVSLSLAELHAYAATHLPDIGQVHTQAMNRMLGLTLARLLEVTPTPEERAQERARLMHEQRLADEAALSAWAERNHWSPSELDNAVTERATCRRLHAWLMEAWFTQRSTRPLLDELRLSGRYEALAAAAAAELHLARHAAELGVAHEPTTLDWEAARREHLAWTGVELPAPATLVEQTGLMDEHELLRALARSRTARRALAAAAITSGSALSA
jgi:hypothetical protein